MGKRNENDVLNNRHRMWNNILIGERRRVVDINENGMENRRTVV